MKWFAAWLLTRMHLSEGLAQQQTEARVRCGLLEGWVSVVLNTALGLGKLGVGFAIYSTGLIADAIHSLSDTASSVVVMVGFYAAAKPPDAEHPFGHAKAEHIASLVLAIMLVAVGLELLLAGAKNWWQASNTSLAPVSWRVLGWLGASVVLKELMARFSFHLAHFAQSQTLSLDGMHHRSDALSTMAVIGGLLGRNYGWFSLDSLAGMGIGLWLMWIGVREAKIAISPLLGEGAQQQDLERVASLAHQVPSVKAVHDLRMHKYGGFHFTTLHIEVPDYLGIHTLHHISMQVEARVLGHFAGECVVHLDPVNTQHPLYAKAEQALRELAQQQPSMISFRDLHFWEKGRQSHAGIEVVVATNLADFARQTLKQHLQRVLQQRLSPLRFHVHITEDHSATSPPAPQTDAPSGNHQ